MATLHVFCAVVNVILNIIYLNVKFKVLNMKQTRNMFKESITFINIIGGRRRGWGDKYWQQIFL